jgi:hypothetical protein
MGYMVSSLAELPVDNSVAFYIFAVAPHGWKGGLYDVVEKNFSDIAGAIGQEAVIVKGLNTELFGEEVCTAYLGKHYPSLLDDLPALLITNTHPEKTTQETFKLFVPLRRAEQKFGSVDAFLSRIVRFVRNGDQSFLDLFQKEDDFIREGANMLELKPNFCGIGININAIIEWLIKRREGTA